MKRFAFGNMGSLLSLSFAAAAPTAQQLAMVDVLMPARGNRIFGAENISRHCKQALKHRDHASRARTSIATGNRHGGPHLHLREKARRVRQMER